MYKVIVVDDELKIRSGLKSIVNWNDMGYEVIGDVCNGKEAIEFVSACRIPDVILTDIRMPVMDGIELIEEIKKRYPEIECIILSGYDQFEYAKKAIELGAFDYILKPTKLPELQEKFIRLKAELDKKQENLQPQEVHKICIELIIMISRHCQPHTTEYIRRIFDEDRFSHLKLSDFDSLHQLKVWMLDRIVIVIDLLCDLSGNNSGRIVRHMKRRVEEKYYEQMTLSSIAESLYMNPDYLSRLFKKDTGQSFTNYLTCYRIEIAKRLLKDASQKSYEIGKDVGYHNPEHFAKMFKKHTGKSVTEYRNKQLGR